MGIANNENINPLLIVVAGPTASGKTGLAINLAKKYDTQILSADSRQCYMEMNIGVARPTSTELATVPHHFIASHSIYTPVDAASYEAYSLPVLQNIFKRKQVAVLVGGTGLYIKALCEGVDIIPPIPENIRKQVRDLYEVEGLQGLQQTLKKHDSVYYEEGEIKNPHRVMRALEVSLHTGQSIKAFHQKNRNAHPFRTLYLAIDIPKLILHQNINQRVDEMIKAGLLEEAATLHPQKHLNALQTVGYKEIFEYLEGKSTLDEAVELIKIHTRQYAKRQITWFKKIPGIHWINPANTVDLDALIAKHLQKTKA